MPISWMPLAADYNRFSKESKGAFLGTFIGFTLTNILFYFGGVMLGLSDVVGIIADYTVYILWIPFVNTSCR